MNNDNWAKIYTTTNDFRADMAKGALEAKDIQCVLVNKKDSAYGVFGEIELYVQREKVIIAKRILTRQELDS